jgi:photosystem II stability/assembly factor-like uncharacterized protein
MVRLSAQVARGRGSLLGSARARLAAALLCSAATFAAVVGFAGAALADPAVTLQVGPTRLLSPTFGYTVAYRTVDRNHHVKSTLGVFVYDEGSWRNVTPRHLHADAIDDIDFLDSRHGWLAAYDCANVSVNLYRTSDGGRTWQSLGAKGEHSCGGGPTWLSFTDQEHGWMEPVSPNGPAGVLLQTSDGGRTWKPVASLERNLPCLAPIAFVSHTAGWMGRCDGHVYSTSDGGRRWHATTIRVARAPDEQQLDVPRFFGHTGVEAATLGKVVTANRSSLHVRAVAFSVSADRGRTWRLAAERGVTPCTQYGVTFYPSSWPAGIAGRSVWWVVSSGLKPLVQITDSAGRVWHTVVPRGLPRRACAITSVTATNDRVAWVVARSGAYDSELFETRDGGHTWRHETLLR